MKKKTVKRLNLQSEHIVFIVLGLFVLALTIFVVLRANMEKQDKQTTQAAMTAAEKLDDYVTQKNRIPTTLSQAGVSGKVPKTIHYDRISIGKYRICIDYRLAKTVTYSPGVGEDVLNSFSSKPVEQLEIPDGHVRGSNCQIVQPNLDPTSFAQKNGAPAASGYAAVQYSPEQGCGVPGVTSYELNGMVSSVQQTGEVVHGVNVFTMQLKTDDGSRTIRVPEESVVFDHGCDALDHDVIQAGDTVSVFNQVNLTPGAIIDQNTAYVVIDYSQAK